MLHARVATGVSGLDDLIEGGFPRNRSVLICGDTGAGKTILSLQFLMEGVRRGEPGVLVTADQKPQHLLEDGGRLGWDLAVAVEKRLLLLLDASPFFTTARRQMPDARQVAGDLVRQIRAIKAQRLVIDSLTSLIPDVGESYQCADFIRSLVFSLEDNLGCTPLLTARTFTEGRSSSVSLAIQQFASGIVELNLRPILRSGASGRTEGFERSLLILKMRGTALDLIEHSFEIIDHHGLVLHQRTPHTVLSQKSAS